MTNAQILEERCRNSRVRQDVWLKFFSRGKWKAQKPPDGKSQHLNDLIACYLCWQRSTTSHPSGNYASKGVTGDVANECLFKLYPSKTRNIDRKFKEAPPLHLSSSLVSPQKQEINWALTRCTWRCTPNMNPIEHVQDQTGRQIQEVPLFLIWRALKQRYENGESITKHCWQPHWERAKTNRSSFSRERKTCMILKSRTNHQPF